MSDPRTLNGLLGALGLLTRFPVPPGDAPDCRSVGWFGAVGLGLGASAALPVWLVLRTGVVFARSPLPIAVMVVAWWAWATRMLHLDAVADAADGAWGAHEPVRRLEIMADSRIGAFGAAAVALVLLAEVAGVSSALQLGRVWPLLVAPVAGRVGASLLVWGSKPLRPTGLGAALSGGAPAAGVVVTAVTITLALSAVAWQEPAVAAPAALVALATAIVIPFAVARPFGGFTGDVLGASIVLVEAAVLLLGGLV